MTFERRSLGRGGHVLVSTSLERDGFLAAFTERTGGASPEPYDSLNLSYFVGDEQELVARNRTSVIDGLAIPPFTIAEQVHGTRVVKVGATRGGAGFEQPEGRIPNADAMVTTSAGVALAVLTADCVPLIAGSDPEQRIAIAHAGWRGIAGGIVARIAELFEDRSAVRVALGPAVGPDHYEVGEDVALAVSAGTEAGAVSEVRGQKTYLDLIGTIRAELRALGIRKVDDTGMCTMCERRRFFSYRADEITGRQAGIAVRLG